MTNQTTDASRDESPKTPYGEALTKAIADGADEYSFAMGYRTALDIATQQPMPMSEDEAVELAAHNPECYKAVMAYGNDKGETPRDIFKAFYRVLAATNTPTLTGDSCERCVQLEAALREARDTLNYQSSKIYMLERSDIDPRWMYEINKMRMSVNKAITTINAVLGEKAGM